MNSSNAHGIFFLPLIVELPIGFHLSVVEGYPKNIEMIHQAEKWNTIIIAGIFRGCKNACSRFSLIHHVPQTLLYPQI